MFKSKDLYIKFKTLIIIFYSKLLRLFITSNYSSAIASAYSLILNFLPLALILLLSMLSLLISILLLLAIRGRLFYYLLVIGYIQIIGKIAREKYNLLKIV